MSTRATIIAEFDKKYIYRVKLIIFSTPSDGDYTNITEQISGDIKTPVIVIEVGAGSTSTVPEFNKDDNPLIRVKYESVADDSEIATAITNCEQKFTTMRDGLKQVKAVVDETVGQLKIDGISSIIEALADPKYHEYLNSQSQKVEKLL